jgi:glycosyltransferase involved in cell wall biosynthesis
MDKLGFYCSSISWGGLEMNFTKYATWLNNRNYHVIVYCVENSPIAKTLNKSEIKVRYVSRNKKYFDLINAFKISRLVKEDNVRALWLRDTRDISTIGIAKSLSSKRFKIIYQQAMQIGVNKRDLIHTIRFSKIDAWISPLIFLAKQVTELTRFSPNKISVIPLATEINDSKRIISKDEARDSLQIPKRIFTIGILGRIDPQKGQLFVINALAKLRQENLDIQLLIVGEPTQGEGEAYYKQMVEAINKLEINAFVHFRPFTKDVIPFFSAVDLFIMASKGETFGTVTIEAMTLGIPVLGTNSAGTPEILKKGEIGYLYEVDNESQFCAQIHHIFHHPDDAIAKSKAAQKIALEVYQKDKVCDRFELLLNQLDLSSCKQN